jgi:hypothetical protein
MRAALYLRANILQGKVGNSLVVDRANAAGRDPSVSLGCTVSQFCKLFPDQQAWILRMAGSKRHSSDTIHNVFYELGYQGPTITVVLPVWRSGLGGWQSR